MTEDMFPGQDRDQDYSPGAAFAAEFADEPPLIDLVPRALARYEQGRRRRQAAGVGGALAAVAVTALVATQPFGGAGPDSAASAVVPGHGATPAVQSSPVKPVQKPSPPPTPATSASTPSGPCDKTFTLDEKGTGALPIPSQAVARRLCEQGLAAMSLMLPGHTWAPIKDPFVPPGGKITYLADDYAPGGGVHNTFATDISGKPYFAARCSDVWYPQTTCQEVSLAGGVTGIEFGGEASGGKPGGYQLYVDLPGGRQFQFQFAAGFQPGETPIVTLDGFLKLVKSTGFADYLKQYRTVLGS